jgi:hypothetical protein
MPPHTILLRAKLISPPLIEGDEVVSKRNIRVTAHTVDIDKIKDIEIVRTVTGGDTVYLS